MSGDAYLAAAAFKFGFIHEGAQVGGKGQRCRNAEAGEEEEEKCQNSSENLPEPGPK